MSKYSDEDRHLFHVLVDPDVAEHLQHIVQSTSFTVSDVIELWARIDKRTENAYRQGKVGLNE